MSVWIRSCFNRNLHAWLSRVVASGVLFLCADAALAQSPALTTVGVTAGAAFRGSGNVDACCGPAFRPERDHGRSLWLSAGMSRDVAPRLALDAELSWAREPEYSAYVQAALGAAPRRGYKSDNRLSALTTAGLLRWHAWRRGPGVADLVGGLAWVHEHRESHLESVNFRPQLNEPPLSTLDIADFRNTVAAVFGVDVEKSNGVFSIVAQGRVHLNFRGDSLRSDLDLGWQVWRIGGGTRVRF